MTALVGLENTTASTSSDPTLVSPATVIERSSLSPSARRSQTRSPDS